MCCAEGGWAWGQRKHAVNPSMGLGRRIHAPHGFALAPRPSASSIAAPSLRRVAGRRKIKFKFKFKFKSRSRNSWLCFCPAPALGSDASAPAETVMGGRGPQPGPLAPRMAPSSPHGWVHGVSWLRPLPPATTRRQTPQPRALLGFTRFPKKIALISSRSVPCQYLRCAGSSANSTTLPCPCADTSTHALPATRARLRSER